MHPDPGQPGEQGLQHVGGCPGVVQGPVPGLGLMRAIKDQFDPQHMMAPGRFAGGI